MATGPEHYREAQRLVERAKTGDGGHVIAMEQLAAAQVHATLALAAATALNDFNGGTSVTDYHTWQTTCGTRELAKAHAEAADRA